MAFGHNKLWRPLAENSLCAFSNFVAFGHNKLCRPPVTNTQCAFSNVVVFGHTKLWLYLASNSLLMTYQMLWPLVTTNCGCIWPQIVS